MNFKNTTFYHKNKEISFNFSAEAISSDGGLLFLERLEKKYRLIQGFSKLFKDKRHPSYVEHSVSDILKQLVIRADKEQKILKVIALHK